MRGGANAQANLAWALYKGLGVPKNYPEAFKWATKAAAQDNRYAQHTLGEMYLTGSGAPKNYRKAIEWFRLCASIGDEDCKQALSSPALQPTLQALAKEKTRLEEKKRRAKQVADAKMRDRYRKEAAIEVRRLNTTAVGSLTKASRHLAKKNIGGAVRHARRCINDWEELTARFPTALTQPKNIKLCAVKLAQYQSLDREVNYFRQPGAILEKSPSREVVPLLADLILCEAWEARSNKAVTVEVNKRGLRCAGMLRQANTLKIKKNEEAERRRQQNAIREAKNERERRAQQAAAIERQRRAQQAAAIERERRAQQAAALEEQRRLAAAIAAQQRAIAAERERAQGWEIMRQGLGIMRQPKKTTCQFNSIMKTMVCR